MIGTLRPNCNGPARKRCARQGTASGGRYHGLDRVPVRPRGSLAQFFNEPFSPSADFAVGQRQLTEDWNLVKRTFGSMDLQRCLECGERELVDSQCPGERT